MIKLKKIINKEWLYRALRTFIQAFLGSVVVIAPTIDYSSSKEVLKGALISLLISAISSGISAVMNMKKGEVNG